MPGFFALLEDDEVGYQRVPKTESELQQGTLRLFLGLAAAIILSIVAGTTYCHMPQPVTVVKCDHQGIPIIDGKLDHDYVYFTHDGGMVRIKVSREAKADPVPTKTARVVRKDPDPPVEAGEVPGP